MRGLFVFGAQRAIINAASRLQSKNLAFKFLNRITFA
jgi:hypothetical protein